MDQLFHKKWVRYLGLYASLAIALVLAAQRGAHADATASQLCVPVEVGEWDCDLRAFSAAVKCAEPVLPENRDPVWQTLESELETVAYLMGKYKQLGSATDLGQWLSCQGFYIHGSPEYPKTSLKHFEANYNRKKFAPFKLSWFNPLSWTSFYDYQAFVFEFDEGGRLGPVKVIEPL